MTSPTLHETHKTSATVPDWSADHMLNLSHEEIAYLMSLSEEEVGDWYLRLSDAAKIVLAYEYNEFIAAKLSEADRANMPVLGFGPGKEEYVSADRQPFMFLLALWDDFKEFCAWLDDDEPEAPTYYHGYGGGTVAMRRSWRSTLN